MCCIWTNETMQTTLSFEVPNAFLLPHNCHRHRGLTGPQTNARRTCITADFYVLHCIATEASSATLSHPWSGVDHAAASVLGMLTSAPILSEPRSNVHANAAADYAADALPQCEHACILSAMEAGRWICLAPRLRRCYICASQEGSVPVVCVARDNGGVSIRSCHIHCRTASRRRHVGA